MIDEDASSHRGNRKRPVRTPARCAIFSSDGLTETRRIRQRPVGRHEREGTSVGSFLARVTALAAVAAFTIGLVTTGCSGSTRSAAAYCSTFKTEAVRIHDKYQARLGNLDPKADPLGSLLVGTGSLIEAQGDLVVLFDKLADHAPNDIVSETRAVRDSLKAQSAANGKTLSDPLGALGDSVMRGLSSMGSTTAVESYIRQHCDLSFMTSRP